MQQSEDDFMKIITKNPASLAEAVICFLAVWSVLGLAGFHTYLMSTNQTTNEDIKGAFALRRREPIPNPYTYSNFCLNCAAVLCGPMQPSLIGTYFFVFENYNLQLLFLYILI